MPRVARKKKGRSASVRQSQALSLHYRVVIVVCLLVILVVSVLYVTQYKEEQEQRVLGEKALQMEPGEKVQRSVEMEKKHEEVLFELLKRS